MTSPSWQSSLSIVIPALNEEPAIGLTLKNLCDALPDAEIIVVDDGSSDGTAREVSKFSNVRLISHGFNRGYGAALKSGMRLTTRDYVAWFDADAEHRVEDLSAMVDRLENDGLLAVLGQRTGSASATRSLGKLLIRTLARLLRISAGGDINCGLRVFRREVILPYLTLLPNGYSASLTSTMILLERGYPVAFQPITVAKRIGTSKVALSDGFGALVLVLRMITLFAPLRIFLPVGLGLLLTGGIYGAFIALSSGTGVPTLAVLSVLVGLMLCLQGLVADQISYMRLSQLEAAAASKPPEPKSGSRDG